MGKTFSVDSKNARPIPAFIPETQPLDSKYARPIPAFFPETQPLSTKKVKRLLHPIPRDVPPPKPIFVRSAHWSHRKFEKAHAISFRENSNNSLILNKHYDESRSEVYFKQCFTIISVLGAGSFGKVFKVQSKEDGKFYAVKKSLERFRGEHDRRCRLEEVKKHEQLPEHPNCVTFIKAWEERNHLYIQTELCETSLNVLAEQNDNIPEKLIWCYLVDLLQAVKHLHDHNLIHLDIKPANIFVSSHGVCKLGDFGLVVDLTKPDSQDPIEGDPKYLPSELMSGTFTKAADIFSLGITMLELSCDLDLPQSGEAWHQLRSGKLPSEFIEHLSPDLVSIISAMLNPNHSQRPTADQLLRHPAVCKITHVDQVLVANLKVNMTLGQLKVVKCSNSELNLKEWRSYLYTWRSGWNSIVSLCMSLVGWFRTGRPQHRFSPTSTTPKRNILDFDLSISDDEDLFVNDSEKKYNSENSCVTPITSKRNILDLDLSISDDEDLYVKDTTKKYNLENLCVTPIKFLLNSSHNAISDDEQCNITNSDKRLVNSTPVHNRVPSKREASLPLSEPRYRHRTTSNCDNSHRNGSSFEDSSRYQIGPKNLLELFDSMSDDDDD